MTSAGGGSRERGASVAVEAAMLIPAFLLMIGVIVYLAGAELTRQAAGAAAGDAARAASIARNPAQARQIAEHTAATALAERNVDCVRTDVQVDTSGWLRPGQVGRVSVTLECTVSLAQVAIAPLPGSYTISVERSAPVDAFRSR